MRRPVFVAVVSALLLVACSDQPTEGNAPDRTLSPSPDVIGVGCPTVPTTAQILTQVNQLLPNSPIRTTVIALVNGLPSRLQDRIKTTIRNQIFVIQDFILKAFYAGKLNGGTSASTFDKVLELIRSLYCYVGLTPPSFPGTTNGQDIAVGVVFPNSPKTTISTPSAHGAVTVPAGAAPAPTTIVVRSLPDAPGPLLTSLDQYPLFFEFSGTTATGPVLFIQSVTVGVCPVGAAPPGNLRLAHNVAPNQFGDVEILPLETTVPGVSCQDVSFLTEPEHSMFAAGTGRWRAVSRALEPFAQALLPEPLHASAVAVTTAVGGTARKFSPFGVVDVASNPGSLSIVNQSGSPISGIVSGPGVVYVKATSENGGPINAVPVSFGGTTKYTGADGNGAGIASFDWSAAAPGLSLTATVPNETVGEGACPIFGSDAAAYRPRVCFTPSSVTFSEPLQLPGFGSTGIHYTIGDIEGFESPSFTEVEWTTTGIAPFGTAGNIICTALGAAVQTEWPINNILLARKSFTLGAVPAGGVDVRVVIDNDVQLFVNGHDVTANSFVTHFPPAENNFVFDGQYQRHGNCPSYGTDGSNFLFHVPASDLVTGTNLLAIRARDTGGVSFLDFEVTPTP